MPTKPPVEELLSRDQPIVSRLQAKISTSLFGAVIPLLAESPDPACSLLSFERLISENSTETVRLLEKHPALAHYATQIFGHSRYLSETLIHNPDLLSRFLQRQVLDRSYSHEDFREALARFRSRSFETEIPLLLAWFKRREYVRIMLRDVLRIAPLSETTSEISALADVLIEEALREAQSQLERKFGPAQHVDAQGRVAATPFCVLSMGKLGGNELNYNSDVDLMYLFGDGTEPPTAPVSNREYFIRLAQQLTEILSRATREGSAFRIDLRLRPQGNEGELAISLKQALHYYAHVAHDWEKQALIKVRYSAGDAVLAREFTRAVQPHVYSPTINFAAIKTALVAREQMDKRRQHFAGDATVDVKLDHGGIRDIEFLVQCLQRVYGGSEPWLRSGGTLFSLQKLYDNRHLSGQEFQDLTTAYEFLRHVEHRLQLRHGQQTHRLPLDPMEQRALQRAMAGREPTDQPEDDFPALVRRRMQAISEIYRRVIYQQQHQSDDHAEPAHFQLHSLPEPEVADRWVADHSNRQLLQRLSTEAPQLYELATRETLSTQAHKNLFRFLAAAFTSSERYSSLLKYSAAMPQALALLDSSEYLTQILIRHPEEIATLAESDYVLSRSGSGYLFESFLAKERAASDPVFAYLATSDAPHSEKLALLRRHYRHRAFAVGAQDLITVRNVYESLRQNTAAADDAIAAALGIAGAPESMAVMALGRLGSGEFDVFSDADLLFVCDNESQCTALARVAAQIVQALSAYTLEGMVFPVDVRLRPHGREGELVLTPAQMTSYFKQEAHAWEALTYTKLRFLAGSRMVGDAALTATQCLFDRFANDDNFASSVREMRSRLEPAERSLKTSPGGTYDIDFLCSYLLIKYGVHEKGGNLRDRIWRCVEAGALPAADARVLDHAAELLRTTGHLTRLVTGRDLKWTPSAAHPRYAVERLTNRILQREFPSGLESALEQNCKAVREIYQRTLGAPPG